ncbi:E3 ubiquitin-protein ligase TRIM38 [Dasypus novemcinctus]|uniref:E3 ubiquitin-protein ligase TRIM38 n=1 Tax=Dasypus novemcinctus TaxID=9361 RepID=UPI00032904EA|nr:E3 ubiquitin-protein ligase TRIM38 [Dasypus novemcinctus]
MASATPSKMMREEATCSICLNLMVDPMSISCGHSYCHLCLLSFIKNMTPPQPEAFACPQCRVPFQVASIRPNRQLGGLIDIIKNLHHDMSCEEHGEQLQLFCEDDGQLICWRCERAPRHKGHTTTPVEDACPAYKEKLQKAVTRLKQVEAEYKNLIELTTKQVTKWKTKIRNQKEKIDSDFQNLHNFLHEEEKSYLWRLEKEEEQTLKKLGVNEENLLQKSCALRSHILELEERCQGSDQEVLQDVKDALSKVSAVKLETPEAEPLELQTACNVPELYLDVKKMLRRYQVSVTLDPDTAHPALLVSEDSRQVIYGSFKNLDISSRRFSALPCVLGCEGFTSGKHYFEVDVGEGTAWEIGVCLENVQRGLDMKQKPEFGCWAIRLCREKGFVALTSPRIYLHLKEHPLLIGVFLDCEAGVISFYNMTTGSHIFTFPKASFPDILRPYFRVYQCSPLFLPPPDE